MATPQGSGYRDERALEAWKKKTDDDIRQLRERNARPAKITPALPGGIVDIARIESVATFPSFAGLPWASGEVSPNALDTTYGAATSMVDSEAVSWLTVADGGITPIENGFYQAWCYVYFKWPTLADACGAAATLYLNGNDAPDSGLHTVYDMPGVGAVLTAPVTNGPEWMTTSDTWRLEADGFLPTSADVEVSTVIWRITQYG